MDFFTFIIIGVFIYSFFSKKDKPPQRTRRPVDHSPTQSAPEERSRPVKKKESFFESLERQIRESAEALEKELGTGGKEKEPRKPAQKPVERQMQGSMEKSMDRSMGRNRRQAPKTAIEPESYYGVEGAWGVEGRRGVEGRSDYSRHQSKQGKVIPEKKSIIEQTSVETGAQAIGSEPVGLEKAVGFSSSAIVQGVIWSEILKEPRGRRAFNRR